MVISEDCEALFADGFEEALIGVGMQFSNELAIYDYEKCLEILMKQGLEEQEAHEHLSFNVLGSWVGENTPVFLMLHLVIS